MDPVDDLPIFAYAQQDADFTGVEAEFFAPVSSAELEVFLNAINVGDSGALDCRC